MLTARVLLQSGLNVMGWIFNDDYLDYEADIVDWSRLPWIASVRNLPELNKGVIHAQAVKMKEHLKPFFNHIR